MQHTTVNQAHSGANSVYGNIYNGRGSTSGLSLGGSSGVASIDMPGGNVGTDHGAYSTTDELIRLESNAQLGIAGRAERLWSQPSASTGRPFLGTMSDSITTSFVFLVRTSNSVLHQSYPGNDDIWSITNRGIDTMKRYHSAYVCTQDASQYDSLKDSTFGIASDMLAVSGLIQTDAPATTGTWSQAVGGFVHPSSDGSDTDQVISDQSADVQKAIGQLLVERYAQQREAYGTTKIQAPTGLITYAQQYVNDVIGGGGGEGVVANTSITFNEINTNANFMSNLFTTQWPAAYLTATASNTPIPAYLLAAPSTHPTITQDDIIVQGNVHTGRKIITLDESQTHSGFTLSRPAITNSFTGVQNGQALELQYNNLWTVSLAAASAAQALPADDTVLYQFDSNTDHSALNQAQLEAKVHRKFVVKTHGSTKYLVQQFDVTETANVHAKTVNALINGRNLVPISGVLGSSWPAAEDIITPSGSARAKVTLQATIDGTSTPLTAGSFTATNTGNLLPSSQGGLHQTDGRDLNLGTVPYGTLGAWNRFTQRNSNDWFLM